MNICFQGGISHYGYGIVFNQLGSKDHVWPDFQQIFSPLAISIKFSSNINTDIKVVRTSNSFSNFIVIIDHVSYIENETCFTDRHLDPRQQVLFFNSSNIKSLLTDTFNHCTSSSISLCSRQPFWCSKALKRCLVGIPSQAFLKHRFKKAVSHGFPIN